MALHKNQLISRWVESKKVSARGQERLREGRSTLVHILTLRALIKQEIFAS